MADFTPIKTLVELIRTTGWWPPDVPSSLNGKASGEVVSLDSIAPVEFNALQWEMHSEKADAKSLPVAFRRYELRFVVASERAVPRWPWQKKRTFGPNDIHVLVADRGDDPKDINPLTDCCALVPFNEKNQYLHPAGRVELAKQAIAVLLTGIGAWPHRKPMSVAEAAVKDMPEDCSAIMLERGKDVAFKPEDWAEPMNGPLIGFPPMVNVTMGHKPTNIIFTLFMYREKVVAKPVVIDPYTDCATMRSRSIFLKIHDELRAEGHKLPPLPSDQVIDELGRAAIVAFFSSVGVWPLKADNLALKLSAEKALSKLDEMKTRWPEYSDVLQNIEAGADIPGLRKLHAHLEGGEFDVSPVARRMRVQNILSRLEKLGHRIEQFEKAKPRMVAQLQGKQTDIRGALQAQFHFQSAIDAFLFMLDERRTHWPPVVIEDLEMSSRTDDLRRRLVRLEGGELDPKAEMRFVALVRVMRDLEKMDSLDETGWQQAEIRSMKRVIVPRLRRLVFGNASPEERTQARGTQYPLQVEAQELLRCGFSDDDFDFGSMGNAETLAWLRKLVDTFPPHEDDRKWLTGPDQGGYGNEDDDDEMAWAAAQS